MKKSLNKIFCYIILASFPFFLICCTRQTSKLSVENEKIVYDYSELQNSLGTWLQSITKINKFSGIINICKDEDVIYSESFYHSPNLNDLTFDCDTEFMIGSLTKQFTAMAILILQQQGKLQLTDNMEKHIPNFPYGNCVNIHDILTHTSGLPRDPFYEYMVDTLTPEISECYLKNIVAEKRHIRFVLNEYTYNDRIGRFYLKSTTPFEKKSQIMNILFTYCYALDAVYDSGYELVEELLRNNQIKIISTPGKKYNYSNLGYIILGYLVEKLSGKRFADFLQDELFTPLGMTQTGFGYTPTSEEVRFAPGISEYNKIIERDLKLAVWPGPAGGLHSTVNDLQKWATFLTNDDILPFETKSILWGQYRNIGVSSYGYGLLCTKRKLTDKTVTDINHNGFIMSYNSSLHILPKEKIKIVILSNDERYLYAQENWINRILNIIFADKTIKSQFEEESIE